MDKTGIQLIAEERIRQIDVEGWSPEHDAEHDDCELVRAGIFYAEAAKNVVYAIQWATQKGKKFAEDVYADKPLVKKAVLDSLPEIIKDPLGHHYGRDSAGDVKLPRDWPWDDDWWKPSNDPIRNLVKAGALIAAEIDRLQRKEK